MFRRVRCATLTESGRVAMAHFPITAARGFNGTAASNHRSAGRPI